MKLPGVATPLRHRPFRLIFTGQVLSGLGDWLDFFALVVLVTYFWNMGPAALAAIAIAVATPWVVLGPLAGVLADRLPTRVALVGSDLARAVVVLGLIVAPNLPVLLTLVAVKVCFSTVFAPAEQVAVKRTVPDQDLLAANSLTAFASQATKVIGPALGGLLVGLAGPRWAFGVDAVTFLLSAAVLCRIDLRDRAVEDGTAVDPSAQGTSSFRRDFTAGISYIVRSRPLLLAIGSMTATMFLVFAFDTLSPLALKELGADASLLGLAMACVGAGAAIGTVAIGQWGRPLPPLVIMGASQACAGLLVACLGVALVGGMYLPPAVLLFASALIGGSFAGLLVGYPYALQRATPTELMGRINATAGVFPTVTQLAAPPLGAMLAARHGLGSVLLSGGIGLALVGGALVTTQTPGRKLDATRRRWTGFIPRAAEADVVAHLGTAQLTGTGSPNDSPVPEGVPQRRASFFW